MKSTETTAAQGRAIALEILRSAENESDLGSLLEFGLGGSTFYGLAARRVKPGRKTRSLVLCGRSSSGPVSSTSLSGLKPQLFLDGDLPEVDAVAVAAQGLFEMARSLYLGAVQGADRSDLEVWLERGLQTNVRAVNERFIGAYAGDSSMIGIELAGSPVALCSFAPLNRLVLTDG